MNKYYKEFYSDSIKNPIYGCEDIYYIRDDKSIHIYWIPYCISLGIMTPDEIEEFVVKNKLIEISEEDFNAFLMLENLAK